MTARWLAMALGGFVLAAAGPVGADDHAVHRGGGDGGSHASSSADRHPAPEAHSSSSSSSSSDGSRSSAFASDPTGAQARHPRPGTGTGRRGYGSFYGSPYYYGSPGYYRPFRYGYGYGYGYYPYDGFYGSLFYGYSPYYYSGYYGYSPYYYGSGRYGYGYGYRSGALRLLVEPHQARVYVDGYYAGIVDDFDGIFQRLYISPGRHEITLKLEGFRSYRLRVYVPIDQTVKIHYRMVPGSGTEVDEATLGTAPVDDARYDDRSDDRPEGRDDRYDDRVPREPPAYEPGSAAEMGTLRVDAQPEDASVYVDGQFKGTARQLHALSLPAGRHHVEIVRPGFRTVERDVEVQPGRTTNIEAELGR